MSVVDTVSKKTFVPGKLNTGKALAALERQIEKDLEILAYPEKEWIPPTVRPDGTKVLDVVVVGAGHCGVAATFALMRERVNNILAIDENPIGCEGPWLTYAQMPTLRTRKTVTGMELGFPNLNFRSFYEARNGEEAYAKLDKITCEEWVDYMLWMRRVLGLPVQNETRMTLLEHDGTMFRLSVDHKGKKETLYARRVVLSGGPYSTGGPNIPAPVKAGLPKSHYAHVAEMVDFTKLKGKKVLVVGAGASAFDNAGSALDHGAASLDLILRRPKIPRLAMIRWTDWSGFMYTLADLPDPEKWRVMLEVQRNHAPPPMTAIRRVEKYPNFAIHFSSPIEEATLKDGKVHLRTPKQTHVVDYVLLGTGYSFDFAGTKELGDIGPKIAVWADRYTPPPEVRNPERYQASPYLGRNFEFTEKVPGTAPYLKHLFNFNQSATVSMGPTGRVSGLKYGVRRLAAGVVGSFFREDVEKHLATALVYDDSEIEGHPWAETSPFKKAKG